MKYYLYDNLNESWSEELYTLQELLFMNNLDDTALLSSEDGQNTLTLGEAKDLQTKQVPDSKIDFPPIPTQPQVKLFSDDNKVATKLGKKEYKVVSIRNKRIDPMKLETILNGYAEMGYIVVSSTSAKVQEFTGFVTELTIILERDK